MFKFITTKPLWVNILAVLVIILVLVFIFFGSLSWITGHGKYQKVPSITGQNVVAAQKTLEAEGFDVEIQDSVFIDSLAKQAVVRQAPAGEAIVKAGRTIYLTVNRTLAPQVEMPALIGFSIRSAQMYLQSLSLKMGDTTYKPDIARNAVLEQLYNGAEIKPGTKIPMGSTISFVLGSGLGSESMQVPDLINLKLAEARQLLTTMNVTIGSIIPRGDVPDQENAFVIETNPSAFSEPVPGQKIRNKIKPGQLIDVYIGASPVIKSVDSIPNTTQQPSE